MAKKKGGAPRVSLADTNPSQAQIDANKPADPVLPDPIPDPAANRNRRNARRQIGGAEMMEYFAKGYGMNFLMLAFALFSSRATEHGSLLVYLVAALLIGMSILLVKGLSWWAGGSIELTRELKKQKTNHTIGWWAGFIFCGGVWGISVAFAASVFLPFFAITAILATVAYIFH